MPCCRRGRTLTKLLSVIEDNATQHKTHWSFMGNRHQVMSVRAHSCREGHVLPTFRILNFETNRTVRILRGQGGIHDSDGHVVVLLFSINRIEGEDGRELGEVGGCQYAVTDTLRQRVCAGILKVWPCVMSR